MKIVITSGGCKVPIDDVRYITNFSSGRYGAQLLYNFWMTGGHDIIFFHEKGSSTGNFSGGDIFGENGSIKFIKYKDYYEYLSVKDIIKREQPDIIISAAAISDYIVEKTEGKISSDQDELIIKLVKGEKVIKSFRELAPNALNVGFKCLVNPTPQEAHESVCKQFDSGVDYVVYNDLSELRKGNHGRIVLGKFDSFYTDAPSAGDLVKFILSKKI